MYLKSKPNMRILRCSRPQPCYVLYGKGFVYLVRIKTRCRLHLAAGGQAFIGTSTTTVLCPKRDFFFPILCPSTSTVILLGDSNLSFRVSIENAGVGCLFVTKDQLPGLPGLSVCQSWNGPSRITKSNS